MRFKFAFLLIVLLTKGYGQSKEEINLPKGGEEFSFYGTIEFF